MKSASVRVKSLASRIRVQAPMVKDWSRFQSAGTGRFDRHAWVMRQGSSFGARSDWPGVNSSLAARCRVSLRAGHPGLGIGAESRRPLSVRD